MSNNESDSSSKYSKYNAAVAQLYRLNDLWETCHLHSKAGSLGAWNTVLDCIWRELAADASPEHFTKFNNFSKAIIKNRNHRNLLSGTLANKEIFLRKLQNEEGKGSAYVDEFEDAED